MKVGIILCFFLSLIGETIAQSSVWKVESDKNFMFIGGTVHALRETDYPLPKAYDFAFDQSDVIVLEADVNKLQDPAFGVKLREQGMYADSTTLQSVLSKETYSLLEKELAKHNIPVVGVNKMKPSMVGILLSGLVMQAEGMSVEGVDQHFYEKAVKAEKSLDFLESVESQMDILFSMGEGKEDDFIRYTLENMSETDEDLDKVLKDWRSGRLDNTEELLDEMRKEFPGLTADLLDERNNEWMSSLSKYLTTKEIEFVMFGNMHLAGDTGIIAQLKKEGYKITQVKP